MNKYVFPTSNTQDLLNFLLRPQSHIDMYVQGLLFSFISATYGIAEKLRGTPPPPLEHLIPPWLSKPQRRLGGHSFAFVCSPVQSSPKYAVIPVRFFKGRRSFVEWRMATRPHSFRFNNYGCIFFASRTKIFISILAGQAESRLITRLETRLDSRYTCNGLLHVGVDFINGSTRNIHDNLW